jgi:DnaJ family protein C protein 7
MAENKSWETLKEKGNNLFKQQKYEEAINYYERAIKLNNTIEVLYSNKGTCEKCLKKYKEAIRDYKKALEINPKNTKNLNRLASVYIIVGNLGEAKMTQERALNFEPSNSVYKEQMTTIEKIIEEEEKMREKIKEQKFDEAEEICKKLIEKVSDFSDLKKQYIKILIENVKLQDALVYINKEINFEDKMKDPEIDYLIALTLYYDGQYEKAKRQLNLMKQKNNKYEKIDDLLKKVNEIESVKNKANEIFKQKKYEEAIGEYTKVLEFDPTNKKFNSLILANRALCYQKLKKNKEALHDSNQSIKLNPFYARGYVKRGNVYMELKMYDDAKADFQKAKELDPNVSGVEGYLNDAKNEAEKARKRDYYAILGVDRNADEHEIKRAYKKMAMKYHPDRNAESEETKKMAEKKFIDVNDAYSVLSDPKKKRMYDQGIDPLNPEEASGGGMHFGGDASEILKMFFGGGGSPFGFSTGGSGFGDGGSFRTFTFGGPGGRSRGGGSSRGDPFSSFTFSFQ